MVRREDENGAGAFEAQANSAEITRQTAAVSIRLYTDEYWSLDGSIAALVPDGNGYTAVEAEYDGNTGNYAMELPAGGVYPLACAAYGGVFINNYYNSGFYFALAEVDLTGGGPVTVEVKLDEGSSLSQFHAQSSPETGDPGGGGVLSAERIWFSSKASASAHSGNVPTFL